MGTLQTVAAETGRGPGSEARTSREQVSEWRREDVGWVGWGFEGKTVPGETLKGSPGGHPVRAAGELPGRCLRGGRDGPSTRSVTGVWPEGDV